MNFLMVKEAIKSIIAVLGELIEESGTSGEYDMLQQLEDDLKYFEGLSEELAPFANSYINPSTLVSGLKEHVPDFNIQLIEEYLSIIIERKKVEMNRLNSQIAKIGTVRCALSSNKNKHMEAVKEV